MKSSSKSLSNPVRPGERIEVVDILRGFAILGILLINMSSYSGHAFNPANIADTIDKTTVVLLKFFAQAKFYSLFSFLFGWGMSIQMARAASKGKRFLPLILRRLAILLSFGLIHGIFIWVGDILTTYAIMGLALLLFRKRSKGTLTVNSASRSTKASIISSLKNAASMRASMMACGTITRTASIQAKMKA